MIRQPIFKACIIFMLVFWVLVNSPVGFVTKTEIEFWGGKEPWSDVVNDKYHLDKEPAILYLDAGDAPYFFRANSSCRYSTPLPFQRDDPINWSLAWMPQFRDEAACIKNYQGKFIVMDANDLFEYNWIGLNKANRKDLIDLLERNYTRVWERCWLIYEKNEYILSSQYTYG